MKEARLKAAVKELTEILKEMQEEFNEYDRRKSEWYYSQLEQHHSGLSTDDEFNEETRDRYRELYSHFYVGDIIDMIGKLDNRCKFFEKNNEELQKLIAGAKNRVPADWKEWEVTYKDSQCAVNQMQEFFAPTADQAGEMCKKVYTFEHNTIDILEVKEVKS